MENYSELVRWYHVSRALSASINDHGGGNPPFRCLGGLGSNNAPTEFIYPEAVDGPRFGFHISAARTCRID